MPDTDAGASTILKTVIAALIALTSLLGAVGAWRASEASDNAASAERKGFAELVASRREQARIRARLDATLFDYMRAKAYGEQARLLRRQAIGASREDAARLRSEATALAEVSRTIGTYVDPDAVDDEDELVLSQKFLLDYEHAKTLADLDPKLEFDEADEASEKSEWLVLTTTGMIAAAFFLTLAQVARTRDRRARAIFLGAGIAVMLAAAAALAIFELVP
jgi:hypothetical protein